ncbi:Uncharacterized protein APZ42_024393 [Daphnia magna]|uniref:Uncharacterized protein n=1 Tax=Daphnia magna TaxID=35525 RepID=A0A162DFH3_9CRUS|nr:Uncharacterized protein APZ42_024393 [Daphnia magna]
MFMRSMLNMCQITSWVKNSPSEALLVRFQKEWSEMDHDTSCLIMMSKKNFKKFPTKCLICPPVSVLIACVVTGKFNQDTIEVFF